MRLKEVREADDLWFVQAGWTYLIDPDFAARQEGRYGEGQRILRLLGICRGRCRKAGGLVERMDADRRDVRRSEVVIAA